VRHRCFAPFTSGESCTCSRVSITQKTIGISDHYLATTTKSIGIMAGARGRLHKTKISTPPRRSARRGRISQDDEAVPSVFRDMLLDAQLSEAGEDDRPRKKRRTAHSRISKSPLPGPTRVQTSARKPVSPLSSHQSFAPVSQSRVTPPSLWKPQASGEITRAPTNTRVRQTIEDPDESDDESDMEWEDALGDGDDSDGTEEVKETVPQIGDISITIGGNAPGDSATRQKTRRRAITSVDKKRRVDLHKIHVMCLMYHVHRRNAWCNDKRVQSTLRKIVSPTILANLIPNPEITQYSASKCFVDAMNELKILWSKRFRTTARGMYKPRWADAEADVRPISDFDDLDHPMDKEDFRGAACTLRGSSDVGAQLFCALLRGIGIEARLVCSLQPLPFSSGAERASPQKPSTSKPTVVIDPYNKSNQITPTRPKSRKLSRLERVMGERHIVLNKAGAAPNKEKEYHTHYPIYWIEAFNPAHQKWIPIDTHSTFTVNAPEKLEPPLSYTQNTLSYAIAFEEDYTAKDVTRRYAKAYNAKTRKFRVDCTPGGEKWWKCVMQFFQRSSTLDRDQIEDAALTRKVAAEGIPKNVQDFKGHPVYVLERHLKHNEVIYPLTQVGRVNCGTAMNPKIEPIYRRSNTHIVYTADKWYRMGRDIKNGAQPLKHAKPKRGHRPSPGIEADGDSNKLVDEVGVALYAEFQTEVYIPPPVVKGRVPRNAYGNLDLFVPSMCPPGGMHVRHKLASKASRILGIDFADAVTGFSFKGRHGTAIIQGVVIAECYADAVAAVIEGLEFQIEQAESALKQEECLRRWRRFLIGLRIKQRINAMVIEGETGPQLDMQEQIGREDQQLISRDLAGGFFSEEGHAAGIGGGKYEALPQHYAGGGFVHENKNIDEDHQDVSDSVPVTQAGDAIPSTSHKHSFKSAILDSQALRPRRRSSLGAAYSSDNVSEGIVTKRRIRGVVV